MQIFRMLTTRLIKTDLQATTKDELFEEMVSLFADNGEISDREAALDAIYEREEKMTTGVAPGFALPHGKLAGITGVKMALGISHKGIEYDSLDGEPVHIVLMLFSEPQNPAPHIEALAEIGRLLSVPGLPEKLEKAPNAEAVLKILSGEE